MRELRIALFAVLVGISHQLQAATTERVPGVRIEYPDHWQLGRNLTEAVELARTNSQGVVDARVIVQVEKRRDEQDALSRASQIVARLSERRFMLVSGWPAAIERVPLPLPQRATGPDIPAFRHTLVVMVGSSVYAVTGWTLRDAPESLEDEVRNILSNGLTVYQAADEKASQVTLERLEQLSTTAQPSNAPSVPLQRPAAPTSIDFVADVASTVNTNQGELSVAVSRWGQNIVVATQNGAFSSQAGSPFVPSAFQGPRQPTSGDPSVGWARSGAFYQASIRVQAGEACSIQIGRSNDQGRTFAWNGISPRFCADPAPTPAARCFPDQEHLAVDDQVSNPSLGTDEDSLFVVWRDFAQMAATTSCTQQIFTGPQQPSLSCSSDGGANWSPPTPIGVNSEFPRASYDGTFVWVAFREGNNIMVDKRFPCTANLLRFAGFPMKVASSTPIACPITGIDRCDGNGLSAPTVASDGDRVSVTFATANTNNGDDVVTVESYADSSHTTWSSPMVVSGPTPSARRFMPWTCNQGNGPASRAWIGWYDRRAASGAGASPDLTDYYMNWLGRGINGPSGQTGAEMRMSQASDPQCRAPWTRGPRGGLADVAACPAFGGVAGMCTGGSCTPTTVLPAGCNCAANGRISCACQVQAGAVTPAVCSSICQGNGVPRYGDYNGLGCSAELIAAAWAATVDVNGNPTPGNRIDVHVSTIGAELRKALGTPYSSNFIQRHSSLSAIPEFDLLFASGPPVTSLTHLVRSNDQPGLPWLEQPPLLLFLDERGQQDRPLGASIIQSRYPDGSIRKSALEAVVRMQRRSGPVVQRPAAPPDQYLNFYTRPVTAANWALQGAIQVGGADIRGVTGDPALIQSTRGDNGNFELLVPQGSDLVHYVLDNDQPGSPWRLAGRVIRGSGRVTEPTPVDVAVIQSKSRSPNTNAGDLEAVVRMRSFRGDEYLEQHYFDAGTSTWRLVGIVRANGQEIPVSGTPSLIQSTYGQGSFELLVPYGADVVHYTNDKRSGAWTRVASLYPSAAQSSSATETQAIQTASRGVSVFQSTFGSPGNLEAIVFKESVLGRSDYLDAWFYTPRSQWTRTGPVMIGNDSVRNISGF